jgi:hypothetical protein
LIRGFRLQAEDHCTVLFSIVLIFSPRRQVRRVRRAVEETRAVDDVGLTLEQRRHQHRELRRIELEVRVLDGDDIAARRGESEPDGVPLAAIAFGVNDAQAVVLGESVEDLARAVAGTVIDHDDLACRRQVDGQQPVDDRGNGRALIEDGNDDRDERLARCRRRDQRTSTGIPAILAGHSLRKAAGRRSRDSLNVCWWSDTSETVVGRRAAVRVATAARSRQPLARRAAQRFFWASLIRLRAAADILRGPRVFFAARAGRPAPVAFALPADTVPPPALSRRAAQYFRIRSLTALRCAADMLPRRPPRAARVAVAAAAGAAARGPRSRNSGKA